MSNIILPSDLTQKVETSIERIKAFDPSKNWEPYYVAFSGGKDSVVVKALMEMAGVPFEAVYRHTSVDPPELVRSIYDKHKDVKIEYPKYKDGSRITMWNLIPKKNIPPTRATRYRCQFLKESSGSGRLVVTGVRWAESSNRKNNQGVITSMSNNSLKDNSDAIKTRRGYILNNDNDEARRMVESCYRQHKTVLNPIIDWEDKDIWTFIRSEKIPYCSLYDEGFKRLGCVGCPMTVPNNRIKQFNRWPTYKHNYLLAFGQMLENNRKSGKARSDGVMGNTPESVFKWWMEDKNLEGQQSLFVEEDDV